MTKFYCEYCGIDFPTIEELNSSTCDNHKFINIEGSHKIYNGDDKTKLICRYCEQGFTSLQESFGTCLKHPNGENKGNHLFNFVRKPEIE